MVSRLSFGKAVRQYVISMISLVICLIIPFVLERIRIWKKLTWFYALLGTSMLGVVLFLSEKTYGANISFTIQGITFQPSEFVKILFVFFLAAALWRDVSFPKVIITTVLAGVHVVILVLSKDLGSALIFFICFVFVIFVATRNYWYFLIGTAGGCVAAYVAYQLFDHVRIRVLAWRDPWSYIDNQGFQITQSLFAVGSGSWFGMGLLKGNPKAIPFVDADMIFSSVCEEFGVIFGICLILVCISCFVAMMNTALRIRDKFYQLIVYGFGIMYIFQIFLTIGGGIKFIPLTGVTLPFISYGGSSIMTTMLMFFIVQGIHVRLMKEGEKRVVPQQKEEEPIE
jgi:cell division protein FtsW (lipid II flippase)